MPGMMKKATPKPTATKSALPPSKVTAPKKSASPKASPSTFAQKNKAAEAELKRLMKAGKVKDIAKTRNMIAKKYGVSPNGFTN